MTGGTGDYFNMGTTGWISSGGVLYDHRSNPDGSLASYYEFDSMDSCMGHSDSNSQYHYHMTPACIAGADDISSCLQLGYMDDGFPVYGQCGTYREEQNRLLHRKRNYADTVLSVPLHFLLEYPKVNTERWDIVLLNQTGTNSCDSGCSLRDLFQFLQIVHF